MNHCIIEMYDWSLFAKKIIFTLFWSDKITNKESCFRDKFLK